MQKYVCKSFKRKHRIRLFFHLFWKFYMLLQNVFSVSLLTFKVSYDYSWEKKKDNKYSSLLKIWEKNYSTVLLAPSCLYSFVL